MTNEVKFDEAALRIAVIPARAGSKRIPGKNIRLFYGKPVIAYSIEAARKSGVIDRIVVSTDDENIASIAREYGAETPFTRPPDLSDDYCPTVPVIRHAVTWAENNWGEVGQVCCIYATAPFVMPEDIGQAYARLVAEQVSGYVFSATTFPFPIQRAFRLTQHGNCEMFQPEHYNTRSQDLEEAYQDAGQFYWGRAEAFLTQKNFLSEESKPYILPRYRVQDIDAEEDWIRAEAMWHVLNRGGAGIAAHIQEDC